MKKITMEELQSVLESDKELAKRLEDYVGQEQGPNVQKKMKDFLKGEGYEIEVEKKALSADDLEDVSGGRLNGVVKCKKCGKQWNGRSSIFKCRKCGQKWPYSYF